MTSPTDDNAAAYQASCEQLIAARVVELVAATFWGVSFFGIIDPVVVPEDVPFFQLYLLETGWGLLYTMVVMLPLVCQLAVVGYGRQRRLAR